MNPPRHNQFVNVIQLDMCLNEVKDKTESMNDSNNYRGIAVSGILSKLLDKVIIQSHKAHLGWVQRKILNCPVYICCGGYYTLLLFQ